MEILYEKYCRDFLRYKFCEIVQDFKNFFENAKKRTKFSYYYLTGQGTHFAETDKAAWKFHVFGKKQKIIDEKCTKMSTRFLPTYRFFMKMCFSGCF